MCARYSDNDDTIVYSYLYPCTTVVSHFLVYVCQNIIVGKGMAHSIHLFRRNVAIYSHLSD